MAKTPTANADKTSRDGDILRAPAEELYAEEIEALIQEDKHDKPPGWKMSARAVHTYICGGKAGKRDITPKYMGHERLVEIAIATLVTDRALLLIGEPGTAKCVKGDALVVDCRTGERMTIAEAYQRRNLSIATLGSDYRLAKQTPVDYLENGVRPCFRIVTQLGREVEVTANHPFLNWSGWKPLKDLRLGDRIALPRILPYFGSGELSDAQVKLLAHLIAEGCLTQNVPYFSNLNPEMQRDFSEAVLEAFPDLQAHWYKDGKCCSVSGGRRGPRKNPCTFWLRGLELMGHDSGGKFVPAVVFTLPRRQIALFLNRLFSGDGFCHRRERTGQVTIDYSSKSKRLILDVQHLLLRFGLNARVARRRSGHYRLYIQGRTPCLVFLREIGLLDRAKTDALLAYLQAEVGVENPNLDLIPCEVWSRIEASAVLAGYANTTALVKADRGVHYKGGGPRHSQGISRPRLLRLAERLNAADLQQIATSDVYWDRIVSIEPVGEHRVYDLSIAETHNFVANDIILHNSWLSEHLAAAINGDSTKVVQGTAGTTEEQIRYTWNYAMLIAQGPSPAALIKSPIFRAMESGTLARFEEITRCASEVQDAMISLLSEKRLSVPELATEVAAQKGFSVIATANTRDRGVNDMSAALKRRFNIVVLPTPKTLEMEVEIVRKRVTELAASLALRAKVPAAEAIEKVVTIFRELRLGQTLDGKNKLKTPSGVLSTAEAISVLANSMALAGNFGSGEVTADDLAAGLQGSVVKDEEKDRTTWQEYLTNVLKKRGADWRPLFKACSEHNE